MHKLKIVFTMDREEFKAKAAQRIDAIFDRLDELEAKKEHASESMKEEYHEIVERLKAERDDLKEHYQALKSDSGERWDKVKSAWEHAADRFAEGFRELGKMFD